MAERRQEHGLGRLPAPDERDAKFPMRATVDERMSAPDPDDEAALERGWRYWNPSGWWGDQGRTPQCVAYAWLHYLEDGPVTRTSTPHGQVGGVPILRPGSLYAECQRNDEWPGENYDGTSVRAGAKVLQRRGQIGTYRWGRDVETVTRGLLVVGPVVVGTLWTSGMFAPDSQGFLKPTGDAAGGHAYLLNGVNVKEEKVRIKNSWGRAWGDNGYAWLRFEDLATLLAQDGEACIAEGLVKAA